MYDQFGLKTVKAIRADHETAKVNGWERNSWPNVVRNKKTFLDFQKKTSAAHVAGDITTKQYNDMMEQEIQATIYAGGWSRESIVMWELDDFNQRNNILQYS